MGNSNDDSVYFFFNNYLFFTPSILWFLGDTVRELALFGYDYLTELYKGFFVEIPKV